MSNIPPLPTTYVIGSSAAGPVSLSPVFQLWLEQFRQEFRRVDSGNTTVEALPVATYGGEQKSHVFANYASGPQLQFVGSYSDGHQDTIQAFYPDTATGDVSAAYSSCAETPIYAEY